MNKTRIEWCDYTINPVKGLCPMHCKTPEGYEYCYAAGERGLYKRFKWNPEIRMEPDWQEELPKKPVKVFVGSTMELFGDWVEDWMWDSIWQYVSSYPQHTFIFLTKQPQNLIKFSPFPDNCWMGTSVDIYDRFIKSTFLLGKIEAKVKFISFEPLLEQMFISPMYIGHLDWVIIGAQTPYSSKTAPKIEWIAEIGEAADKARIPIFLKNNLKPLIFGDDKTFYDAQFVADCGQHKLRQEFPG